MNPTRLLVVIANYGNGNDRHLHRLIKEYQSMSFKVDIFVCSNISKPLPPGVTLLVGMPTKDPWSLPFAHKTVLADRLEDYDLFIYSEDDTLATERNIRAFLRLSGDMRPDEILGYIRYEDQPDGTISYCDVNGHYHWDPSSVVKRGSNTFAFFSNEHAAFYLLTQDQLRRAVQSGGFLVAPHRGKYDLACTAATDPYTQCGFRKLLCISSLDEFCLHHLPNKYIGTRFGTHESLFHKQVQALMEIGPDAVSEEPLFKVETRLQDAWYSKDYYEPMRPEVVSEIPVTARKILSVGCGAGETEKWLAGKGLQVTAVCLDPVIGACAQTEGVEVISAGYSDLKKKLSGRAYDCILLSNVLHLTADPATFLSTLSSFLAPGGSFVILVPNLGKIKNLVGKIRQDKVFQPIGDYAESGTQEIRVSGLRKWLKAAAAPLAKTTYLTSDWKQRVSSIAFGISDPLLATEILAVGRKSSVPATNNR